MVGLVETDSSGDHMATESEDMTETDLSGEDMATEAEAETIRPSRHARETQNVFMAASSGMFHNPLRRPQTVGPSVDGADAADDDDNEGFSCKHCGKIYSNRGKWLNKHENSCPKKK